jgi:hypothetical protein
MNDWRENIRAFLEDQEVLEARCRLRGSYRYAPVPWGLHPQTFRLFIPCKIERHCDRDEETCWYNPIRHSCVIHVCNCERPINCSMLSWLCQAPVAIVPGKGCSRSATVMCRANAESGNMPPAQARRLLRILRRPVAIQKSKRNAA